jgi:putative hydrolase of the HAD superfamily
MIKDIGHPVSVSSLTGAFCAMLSDTPLQRISILKKLRQQYRILLLSNTNSIHTHFYREYFRNMMNFEFTGLFDKVYYSNLLGMRKPDREIFEYVLKDSRLQPHATLFLDDTESNILTADALGLQVFQITPEYSMEKVFGRWAN